ncbi:Hypothetical protein CpCap5W_0685 [Corynebacterium pseudotuberculosis]|nr:Hypothetical protein Cp3995_2014 [Corynebacterium pseudotuberculosis 3/99-5]AIG06184.1 hypothetical protein CPTA_00355 [Corynebacterium pseudotuberculosis]AIG09230.1 hypothetical protein CPTB_01174 [Corynebacterium pseudotuberculosis]AIG11131.1 hypothetical protein CPTC_00843 [Corynebacterium pseudotuberculosis]AKC74729.1 Hypothetical protein Cp226_2042 [Corynebacterium pseudotuberculosis]
MLRNQFLSSAFPRWRTNSQQKAKTATKQFYKLAWWLLHPDFL